VIAVGRVVNEEMPEESSTDLVDWSLGRGGLKSYSEVVKHFQHSITSASSTYWSKNVRSTGTITFMNVLIDW